MYYMVIAYSKLATDLMSAIVGQMYESVKMTKEQEWNTCYTDRITTSDAKVFSLCWTFILSL